MIHPFPTRAAAPCRALSIAAFCSMMSLGRTRVFEEIKAGRLRALKTGRRTLIPADEAERWLQSLRPVVTTVDGER